MGFDKSDFASDKLGAIREVVADTLSRGVESVNTGAHWMAGSLLLA